MTSASGQPRARSVGEQPRPTMLDVARLAGVSLKTASRVLNGEPHVTPRTTAKVQDAAAELGFRLNAIARELRLGARSKSVGLIIGDVANPFYGRMASGVEQRLRHDGYQLVTASSGEEPQRELELVEQMVERRVSGLLVTTCLDDHTHLEAERRLGIPFTFLDRAPTGITADTVAIDNEVGAALATRHLLAAGHRRIALIGDLSRLTTHRERVAGFRAELEAAGVPDWDRYVRTEAHDADAAGRAVRKLLALDTPPTALFTTNNRITVGVLRALRGLDARPALVGFDDFELADLLGVTVISHSPEDMGDLGAQLVIGQLAPDAPAPCFTRLPVTLVERGSGERPPQ